MQFYNPRHLRRILIVLSNVPISRYIIFVLVCAIIIHCLILEEKDKQFRSIKLELERELQIGELQNQQLRHKIDGILIKQVAYLYEHSGSTSNRSADTSSQRDRRRGPPQPSLDYELLRRRVQTNILEMWRYYSHELANIQNTIAKVSPKLAPKMRPTISEVLQLGSEHKRSLLSDMQRLRQVDGYEAWRRQESKDLSDLVQQRLQHLQNPKNCKRAAKVLCRLNKGCGYGCQLHHVVYCFIIAYATERTMVLDSSGWIYNKAGWEQIFQPVSVSCLAANQPLASKWQAQFNTPQLWILPIIDRLNTHHKYLPLTIPQDLATRLQRLNGDPGSWWVGQFLKYLLKPQPEIAKLFKATTSKLGWKKPIVGVHVRRTDKVGTESAFHSIDEYMTHVEDYFLALELNSSASVSRRIFLATDEADVIAEARKKYSHYEIIADAAVARVAGSPRTRYSAAALNGIILDIHLLSLSDYLVCAFSSQVCRVAYELMQTRYLDAAQRFKSLDDIYYFGGQNEHQRRAVIGHKKRRATSEIDLAAGDLIKIMGNHWNGYSKGRNTRTNETGLFPSFKVVDKLDAAKFPTYANVRNDIDFIN